MNRFYVKKKNIKNKEVQINQEETHHIINVLRKNIGDKILVFDGDGKEYLCKIKKVLKEKLICEINHTIEKSSKEMHKIDLFQGLPKLNKMDMIIQKTTELGINRIVPITTERTLTKLNNVKSDSKINRWKKISLEASKQSRRTYIPIINNILNFNDSLRLIEKYNTAFFLWENSNTMLKGILKNLNEANRAKKDIKNILFFVGPEGGFTKDEAYLAEQKGANIVSLGSRILRTETAGVAFLSILMYELGDLGGE